ncbi:MAG: S41 family peptidase [Spartobacteria bacterium]
MQRLVLSASLTILLFVPGLVVAQPSPRPSATVAAAPPVASPAPATIDTLEPEDLQKVIPLLKEHYVDPSALSETELRRATLAGLLSRLGRGAVLLPARPAASPAAPPFYREIIAGHIGYLRPGDLSRPQLQEMDTTLRWFTGKSVDAVILDLRSGGETNDYEFAAEFADRFVAKNKPLFSLRGAGGKVVRDFVAKQDPIFSGFVVLLADGETAGAMEALAAVLRSSDKAILIGEKTAGRAVDYTDLPLPSGKILRVAVAEAILPERQPRFPEGIPPDLPVALPRKEKREIFSQSLTKGMEPFVFENDRPHLNEAALLAGTNPEIEAAQAAQQRRAQGDDKPALHDVALQRAVDLVTSIGVYEKHPARSP